MSNWNLKLERSIKSRKMFAFEEALQQGAQINYVTASGESLLLLCCKPHMIKRYSYDKKTGKCKGLVAEEVLKEESKEMAKELIRRGADLDATDSNGSTILNYCIKNKRDFYTLLLISEGANVCLPSNGVKPLELAIRFGNLHLIKTLLDGGADLILSTGFFEAIEKNQLEVIKLFIERGADVNVKSVSGYTPLTKLLLSPHESSDIRVDIVKLLLAAGAKPFQDDNKKRYPFLEAVKTGDLKLVQVMLENQLKINTLDQLLINKALHEAINLHSIEILQLLVANHADLNFIDDDGYSVVAKAINKKKLRLLKYLLRKKPLIDDVQKNIEAYSLSALLNRDLCTLRELAKVAWDFGQTFEKMKEFSKHDDDIKDLWEKLQKVAKSNRLANGLVKHE